VSNERLPWKYINTAIRICEIDQVIAICMMIGLGLRGIEALNAVWCGFKRAPDGGLVYHVMRHKSMNKGDCEPRIIAVSPWLEQLLVTFKEISSDPNYIRSGRMGGHKHRVPLSRANLTGTVSGLKEDFLIPAIDGLSRTNNYIGDALKCINEEIGISGITPHCLRATYADQLNINGLNINDLRISLGHANLATTQRYLNQNLAQSREHQNQIGQKIWPINPGEVLRQLDVGGNTLDAIEGQKSLGLVKANKRAYPNGPAAILLKPRPRSIPAVSDEDFFPTAKFGSDIIDAEIIMPDLAAVYCQRQPGPSLLSRLVWEIPATIIGEIYGVSDVAVAKWCKKAGIKRPTPGYWAKVAAAIVEIKSADANSPVPSPIPGINLEM